MEINCGNISTDTNTFHSQLFGHVKGAFTGAMETKKGLFEIGNQSTILLDDITALPLEMQKGLLKVIEAKKIRRFGDNTKWINFDAKIISTSNIRIEEAVSKGNLREDLRYRLCGEIIYLPPLRERSEDIEAFTLNFLDNDENSELKVRNISKEALALLKRQPWLGNVRQLIYVLNRASVREKEHRISFHTIQNELFKEYGFEFNKGENLYSLIEQGKDLETTILEVRKRIILKSLELNNWVISAASKELGYKNHNGLKYWMKRLGIEN